MYIRIVFQLLIYYCLINLIFSFECSDMTFPTEPNDCVVLSTAAKRCCLIIDSSQTPPTKKCALETNDTTNVQLCEMDYYYDMNISTYDEKQGQKNYCTFNYDNSKGAISYSGNASISILTNGLAIDCINSPSLKFDLIIILYFLVLIC